MPAKGESIERMELRFRADAPSANRFALPGGWALWCLLGCAVGIGAWLAGRQYLAQNLRHRLAEAQSTGEALAAVEGLSLLSPEASVEIVQGLEYPDPIIAHTAYRRLDELVSRWQGLEPAVASQRLQKLAERLSQFSATAPAENRLLANSLAARIYGACAASRQTDLRPTMDLCLSILERTATGPTTPVGDTWLSAEDVAPPRAADQIPNKRSESRELRDQANTTQPSNPDSPTESAGGSRVPAQIRPTASVRLTIGPTQPRTMGESADARSFALESPEIDATMRDPSSLPIDSRLSGSLPPTMMVSNGQSVAEVQLHEQKTAPVIVSAPATLSNVPLVQMKVVSDQPNMDGIQGLEIEELVRLLASPQPRIAQAAALALRAKGMDDAKLALASELANGEAARRLELIQQIASNGGFEPRPWLLWMAEDGQPEVRRMAVSLLSSMLDADVERALRILLAREREPSVEHALRQTLLAGRRQLPLNR